MEYKCIITPRMRSVADTLTEAFVGMDHCITDAGRNLIVEVPKSMCETVRTALKQRFQDVALIRNAYPMMEDLHDFILVSPSFPNLRFLRMMASLYRIWKSAWWTMKQTKNTPP